MKVMLDASALLAYLNNEAGSDKVPATSGEAAISSVNLSEVIAVLTSHGMTEKVVRDQLSRLLLEVVAFDRRMAERAGLMISKTRKHGLSLGDRACLATAEVTKLSVLTADRSWSGLNGGFKVQYIR